MDVPHENKGDPFIGCLTVPGGFSEGLGKTPSILTYDWLVCGSQSDHPGRDWLLARQPRNV